MSNDNALNQSDVEKLLAGLAGAATPSPTAAGPQPPPPPQPSPSPPSSTVTVDDKPSNSSIGQSEIESLLSGKGTKKETPATESPKKTPVPPSAQDNKVLGQNEVESLFKSGAGPSKPAAATPAPSVNQYGKAVAEEHHEEGIPQGDIEYLLKRAEEALESITLPDRDNLNMRPEVIEFHFPEFGGTTPNSDHATLDQISEVELDVKIELGRTNMYLEDVLKLRKGSVVALDKIAGDAVDIFVNGRLIARGEVLVMNDNFCIRVAELLAGAIPVE